jgi:hypothetical protein
MTSRLRGTPISVAGATHSDAWLLLTALRAHEPPRE